MVGLMDSKGGRDKMLLSMGIMFEVVCQLAIPMEMSTNLDEVGHSNNFSTLIYRASQLALVTHFFLGLITRGCPILHHGTRGYYLTINRLNLSEQLT